MLECKTKPRLLARVYRPWWAKFIEEHLRTIFVRVEVDFGAAIGAPRFYSSRMGDFSKCLALEISQIFHHSYPKKGLLKYRGER